jgi:hypothetical protein
MVHPLEHFDTVIAVANDGRTYVPIPFDPATIWGGARHLGGSIGACHFRGVGEDIDGQRGIAIGAAWLCDHTIKAGDRVSVILTAEGPIRTALAPDFAQALAAEPKAAAFWDELAPFYRKAHERWIDATKRRPEVRAARIAEVVALMKAGIKAKP